MNDSNSNQPDNDADFAKALEECHKQIIAGERGNSAVHSMDSQSQMESGAMDPKRMESAVRVLELLEDYFESDRKSAAGIATKTQESTAKSINGGLKRRGDEGLESVLPDVNQLGRFEIIEQIGRGGYGIVVKAHDPDLDRDVAIKVPRLESALSTDARRRFQREARAAAALNHPGIVAVFETGSDQGVDYIVSEFVQGENLADWLNGIGKPNHQEATQMVAELADAVAHAHQRGVLHRDLKPSNILLRSADSGHQPAISDFGLASFVDQQNLTQSGAVVGTPAYMSPEQAQGDTKATGPATDVYGLGAILYQLLTGRAPFDGLPLLETIRAIAESDPSGPRTFDPTIPKDLDAICLKCLEKSPTARYSSAYELQQDLNNFLENRPVSARPVTKVEKVRRWAKRNPLLATISTALFLSLSVGLVLALILWRSSEGHRLEAESNKNKFQSRSSELELFIDQMFQRIEEMPELSVHGMDPVREQMLTDVNRYYTSLLADTPADPELQMKQNDSVLRLANLKSTLTDYQGALEAATLVLDSLPKDVSGEKAQQRIDALMILSRANWNLGNADAQQELLDEALSFARGVYTSHAQPTLDERIEYAKSLSDAASIMATIGDRTTSQELGDESITIWESIDPESIDIDDRIAMIGSYQSAASVHIQSESADTAKLYGQKAIDLIETVLDEPDRLRPKVQYMLSNCCYTMGSANRAQIEKSIPLFERSKQIASELSAAHPLVPKYQFQIAKSNYQIALEHYIVAFYIQVDPTEGEHLQLAFEQYQDGRDFLADLLARFPDEKQQFLPLQINNWTMIGLVHEARKEYEFQLTTLEHAQELALALSEATGTPRSRVDLHGIQGSIAKALLNLKRYEDSIPWFVESNEGLRSLLEEDPRNLTAARFLSTNQEYAAKSYRNLDRFAEASAAYLESVDTYHGGPKENMMGGAVVYLMDAGQMEQALDYFETFKDFQFGLLENDAVWMNGQPPRDDYVVNAMPKLITVSNGIIDALEQLENREDEPFASFNTAVIETAIDALNRLGEMPEFGAETLNTLLNSGGLEALRRTDAFVEWQDSR